MLLAFLEFIWTTIKSSKSYILSHKLLTFGIVVIGIGIGLVFVETLRGIGIIGPVFVEILRLDIKAISWPGMVVIGVGIVGLGVLKPKILWISIGIIGMGIGLIFAENLYVPSEQKEQSKPVSLNSVESQNEKAEEKEQSKPVSLNSVESQNEKNKKMVQKDPLKPVLKESLEKLFSWDMKTIFWLGIVVIGIGVMILGFAVYKHKMIGILGVVVSAVGIILAKIPGDNLLTDVKDMLFPLHSLATNTSKIDTTLKNVEKHINSTLQYLNTHTNTHLQAIQDSLTEAEKRLGGQIQKLSEIKQISEDLKSQEATINSIKNALKFQDSLTTTLKSQKDNLTTALESQKVSLATLESQKVRLTTTLDSQKATTDSIKDELAKAEKAQNSVRLLVDTEQNLIAYGFLITETRFIFKKSYRLVKKLSAEDTLVTTEKPFSLESALQELVGGSSPLELEALVSHSGKLKEYAYTIVKGDSTYITFKSFLGGMDILAVVKKN